MSDTDTQLFASSLAAIDVPLTRTDTAGFASTIDSLVTGPAVGVPLHLDGVSLDDTVVQTPPTPRLLREAETGVTGVGHAIAEHGTLVIDSDDAGTEPVSLYPPTHLAVVRESDILPDVASATDSVGERFAAGKSSIFATGVSSTGDMGALVKGVHGPKHVEVVLLTDQ
ncbi:LUD domain-containing protein [Haloferax denitrificans]|uniref:Lactate utilization protein B/C n=1 Tax=Haloferax denitrificans ATCC 35960 TaxID=662478 RepID=M0J9I2_9EURY|nr:LUD domain-containing protein [Haloferax denitrificans]EMA05777.1 lactate utilization protein B/C [Haloferax denitrificans ATCC 35960]